VITHDQTQRDASDQDDSGDEAYLPGLGADAADRELVEIACDVGAEIMYNSDLGRFHLRLEAARRRLIRRSDRLQSLQRLTAVLDRDHAELGDASAKPFEDENESAQHRTGRSVHVNADFSRGPAHLIEKRCKFCLRGARPAGCLLRGQR